MYARPAAAALGCRGCQTSLFRALLAAGRPRVAASALRTRPVPTSSQSQQRIISTTRRLQTETSRDSSLEAGTSTETKHTDEEETPWFLEEEPPQHAPIQHQQTLPVVPEGAPPVLQPMLKYIFEDMGLDDIALFDLRELDPHAALGPNLIMAFGTARSEKHLHVSAGRFVRWVRKNHKLDAKADGLIGAGELRTKLRRLRKKAKLMGTNATVLPRGDNGISTGWICVSFNTGDGVVNTADASFDDTGRMAGFNAEASGATIVVQCMTEERRKELDLETLWKGMLKGSIKGGRQVDGLAPLSKEELEEQVSARLQMPEGYNKAAQQWEALEAASQRRFFSTSARRLVPEDSSATPAGQKSHLNLDSVTTHVHDLQTSGAPFTAEDLVNIIRHIFQAGPHGAETAPARVKLVDQLLLTAEERGIALLSGDVLITLVESMVRSPAYGPELQRAQSNIEFLLTERRIPPSNDQVRRLMLAYARRQDWDRFWDAFRMPPRFQQSRSPALYELAYSAVAATRDAKLCAEALRWLYLGMGKEDPPVLPTGTLYEALRECILVADPAAEELLHRPPPEGDLTIIEERRLKHREFVTMLRDVEKVRTGLLTEEARRERDQALDAQARSMMNGE